jgi:hypothetical protein
MASSYGVPFAVPTVNEPLPPGILVTSRAKSAPGRRPARYFALFCKADEPLAFRDGTAFSFNALRNLTTGNLVGGSQTNRRRELRLDGQRWDCVASLVVSLVAPYYAEMVDPSSLSANDVQRVEATALTGDLPAWVSLVTEIRTREGIAGFAPSEYIRWRRRLIGCGFCFTTQGKATNSDP